MKRIKAINGYSIYQATSKRDENNGFSIGEYYIYFSSDIRDYGLTNSDPEFDSVDSLNVAMELCENNFAIAKEICETKTTCVSYNDIETVETMLNSGVDVETIENDENDENETNKTFESFLNSCEWFDGELFINGIEPDFGFVWDSDNSFTEYGRNEYGAILNSTDFTVNDNCIELNADCTEQYADLFLALCSGYVSDKYYKKCIQEN